MKERDWIDAAFGVTVILVGISLVVVTVTGVILAFHMPGCR
jgi:hypothetical protein